MKITFLPNWCKWLSFSLLLAYFVVGFPDIKKGFLDGRNYRRALHTGIAPEPPIMLNAEEQKAEDTRALFSNLLFFSSIMIYLLSKDKRDDEYTNAIRAKALLIALMLATSIALLVSVFDGNMDHIDVLMVQFLLYVIIFKLLKIRAEMFAIDEPSTL